MAPRLLLAALVLLSTILAPVAYAQSMVATVNVGNRPWDVAYDPAKGEVFVANGGCSTVSVIEPVPASTRASTDQQSQGQPVAGMSSLILIIVLAIVFAGLAIGIGARKRVSQTSTPSPSPRPT